MADKAHGGIKAGKTNFRLYFGPLKKTADGLGATGLAHSAVTAYYIREGGLPVQISLNALANVDSGYNSGGWKELDATNMKGHYRLDLPDAMIATGADSVLLVIQHSTIFEFGLYIPLESAGAAEVKTVVDAVKVNTDNLPSGVKKGLAFTWVFRMVRASNPAQNVSGIAPTVEVRKQDLGGGNPGNWIAMTNTPTEIQSSGYYWVTVTNAEANADIVALRAIGADAIQASLVVYTEP